MHCYFPQSGNVTLIVSGALTSLQQLQIRREGCIGLCQCSETQVPDVENGR